MTYSERLFALQPSVEPLEPAIFSDADFQAWQTVSNVTDAEQRLSELAVKTPFANKRLPSFDDYQEDWYWIRPAEKAKLFDVIYCERGTLSTHYRDCTFPLVVHAVADLCLPPISHAAVTLAADLDSIKDQRIILWLKQSCVLRQMYELHPQLGNHHAVTTIKWMREELARMGVEVKDTHLIRGLMLSGILRDDAFMMLATTLAER